jgi:hypothetical protein
MWRSFCEGQAIVPGALIRCHQGLYTNSLPIQIDDSNPAEQVIRNASFCLALQTSDFFYVSSEELNDRGEAEKPLTVIVDANARVLHIPGKDFLIRPGA